MRNRMWSACAGRRCDADDAAGHGGFGAAEIRGDAVAAAGHFLHALHIMEKNKLIEKHAAALGVPNVTTKWINLERRRRADGRAARRQRRHRQYRDRQPAAAVGPHPRRREGHRRHLGAADDADQPRPAHQDDQGFRPERQDRGADREGLDAGDPAADRGRRRCSAPTSGRSSTPTPCSSAIPTPMSR